MSSRSNYCYFQDVLCAAAPLALATASELRDSLRDWGAKDAIVRQGWGMTELSPLGSVGRLDETDSEKLLASIGDPVALTELKIVDLNTNEVVDLGREGEICVRGPQVTRAIKIKHMKLFHLIIPVILNCRTKPPPPPSPPPPQHFFSLKNPQS